MKGLPLRSLVVDDSSSVRGLLSQWLGERDYHVTALGSAEEALAAHLEQPFELMLVDWTLPGFDDSSWTFGTYGVGYEDVTGAVGIAPVEGAD